MNTQVAATPIIGFPVEVPATSIGFVSGSFSSTTFPNDTYTFTFELFDNDVDLGDIDVEITNAENFSGEALVAHTETDVFSVDTLIADAPTPDLASGSDSGASNTDDKTNDDDRTFETDGVKVVVDEASLEFIGGSVLNYVESLGGSHFTLENPNATSSCGCGSSFSVY